MFLSEEDRQAMGARTQKLADQEKETRDIAEATLLKEKEDQEHLDQYRQIHGEYDPEFSLKSGNSVGVSKDRFKEMEVNLKGKADLSFIDEFVAATIPVTSTEGLTYARWIKGAYNTLIGAIGSSNDTATAKEHSSQWPCQYQMYNTAMRLRNEGKTNDEIIEVLNSEEEQRKQNLLNSV